ncbi:pentatricopeptide repeat-containing protein At1g08070, chloroplastic-like [Diospyros lotus]|uniref:pentatricopeptide repeat-containing protein At1g08070, chloroplastic-like n=1 Tax=Diospyros lotus TaxID=55363 RepID=UPI0022508AFC|nr:pentatricopeptide repeat-containing protein At1g08070, chloroplastic-like [Diospyros lotus]
MALLRSRAEQETSQEQIVLSLLKHPQSSLTSLNCLKSVQVLLLRTGLHQSSFAVGNFAARCATLACMGYAARLFDQMLEPNSFVWNTMIRGFQQNQDPRNALLYFDRMRVRSIRPDRFTFPFVVRACADLKDLCTGVCVHGQMFKAGVELDVIVGTSLIGFYSGFRDMKVAQDVFDELPIKDTVAWTAILSGYVNQCDGMERARELFDKMPARDLVSWNTMINGYVKIGEIGIAKNLFDQAPVRDMLMYNTILGGYARHGEPEVMLQFFHNMAERDLVSWNSVIGGLVRGNQINEAMRHFHWMQMEKVNPNEVTLKILERDAVAWNAIIMGFSMNGESRKALSFFQRMKNEGVRPNDVTILGVLCACVHSGLVDEGRQFFNHMSKELGLVPKLEHYGCMVDLLGRAGLLNEAYQVIKAMPIEPHSGVWGALLSACKIHGNVDLAEIAIQHLIQLDLEDGGYLAIMSNIYANAGRWNDVAKVREMMTEKRVCKLRGCSSIEINGEIHEFGVEEKIHPRAKEICEMINEISRRLSIAGHVASTSEVFFDVDEEEKEKALHFHSEKMAVAFGLIATGEGTVIRVVKNLRICADCHAAIKLISRIYQREIIVRDRSRFHHFKKGSCSCGDYW